MLCCSVLQCAAVCCSVLQCVAVCCSALQCVAVSVSMYESCRVTHMRGVTSHKSMGHPSHMQASLNKKGGAEAKTKDMAQYESVMLHI